MITTQQLQCFSYLGTHNNPRALWLACVPAFTTLVEPANYYSATPTGDTCLSSRRHSCRTVIPRCCRDCRSSVSNSNSIAHAGNGEEAYGRSRSVWRTQLFLLPILCSKRLNNCCSTSLPSYGLRFRGKVDGSASAVA